MNNSSVATSGGDSFIHGLASEQRQWLGVHELSEFVFCPRAGLLCHQQRQKDNGQERDQIPRLDFLPDFNKEEVEATLELIGQQMERFMVGTIIGGFCLVVAGTFVGWTPIAVIAAVYLIPMRWFVQQCEYCRLLEARLDAAHRAAASEPPIPLTSQTAVNWWSLLKCGMTPVSYVEPHRDRQLRLAGNPWRVLQRGSQRIPVFRKRSGPPELHEQHFIRMAAYCHLIEECELDEVPYGIVLFGDGYDGVAVPITDELREQFRDRFEQAHADLRAFQEFETPPAGPASAAACRNCHLGRPSRCSSHTGAQVETEFATQGADGAMYHSPCGDLCHWVPPTEQAQKLKLC